MVLHFKGSLGVSIRGIFVFKKIIKKVGTKKVLIDANIMKISL